MPQTIINPQDGPPHGGPYSHGIRVGASAAGSAASYSLPGVAAVARWLGAA